MFNSQTVRKNILYALHLFFLFIKILSTKKNAIFLMEDLNSFYHTVDGTQMHTHRSTCITKCLQTRTCVPTAVPKYAHTLMRVHRHAYAHSTQIHLCIPTSVLKFTHILHTHKRTQINTHYAYPQVYPDTHTHVQCTCMTTSVRKYAHAYSHAHAHTCVKQ